jgi:HTH-type transcriptional regulator/antitoxin MqsA
MDCVICDAENVEERTKLRTVDVGAYQLQLDDAFMHCLSCGEDFHTGEQSRAFDMKVVEARRRHEGLLSGNDVKRIRQAVGLSQADFESALGIGPKTIVRWENNLGVQSKTVDDVLRLIEFDPDNLRLLVRIRQAARASMIESSFAPEDHVKRGELQAAIVDGLERACAATVTDIGRMSETIFEAINDYKHQKINRLAEDARVTA